jgi:CheY-like chemotaxis protein
MRRLLLVEDNPADVRVIQRLLGQSLAPRFEITVSGSVAGGLEYLASGVVPDIILVDLSLPDSDPEALDSFHRVHKAAPAVPVIVMTGMSDQEIATRAVRLGAQDFLVKGNVEEDALKRSIS